MSESSILVIGYGNTLRSDDGVGPCLAERVEALKIPRVRVLAVHQLTPDLAADVAEAQLVIFIDATTRADCDGVEISRIVAAQAEDSVSHSAKPDAILGLSCLLYGHSPEAWLVTIRAVCLDYGESLSPAVAERAEQALAKIHELILNRPIDGPFSAPA